MGFPLFLFPAITYVSTLNKNIEEFQTHYTRAGELFLRALARIVYINSEEIFRVHRNFEEQNKVLESYKNNY